MTAYRSALSASALCVLATACLAAPAAGTVEEHHSLAAGAHHEVCFKMAKDETVAYRFEASTPLDFNIHYHADDSIHYPVYQKAITSAEDNFTASRAREYCLMWHNGSSGVIELRMVIGGD